MDNAISDPLNFVQRDQGWYVFADISDSSSDEDVKEDDLVSHEEIEYDETSHRNLLEGQSSLDISQNESYDSERISR